MTALQLSSSSQLCLGMRRRRRRNCIFKIICPSLRGKNMWMKWIWCEIQAGTAISNITQGFIKHSKGISRFYLWNCSCARTAKARHVHGNRIATLNSLSWIKAFVMWYSLKSKNVLWHLSLSLMVFSQMGWQKVRVICVVQCEHIISVLWKLSLGVVTIRPSKDKKWFSTVVIVDLNSTPA